MKDYYEILGVKKTASPEEIRKAFYKLAHQYHPDKGGNEAKFKEINEAYQVLSNKEKRNQYDQFGRVFSAQGGEDNTGWDFNWPWGDEPGGFEANQESDFGFGGLGDLGEMFGEIFGFGGQARKSAKKGRDIEIGLEISLEQALKDSEKEIELEKFNLCQRCEGSGGEPGTPVKECFSCRGTGQVQQIKRTFLGSFTSFVVCPECKGEGKKPEKPCNVCKGEGRIRGVETIKIFIPAGVDQNQVIKIESKGDFGRKGARPGDLYVRIVLKNHPLFERKGDDLFTTLNLSFSQLALGGETEIQDLAGHKIILTISAGSEPGKMLRLSGKGMPHFQGHGQGNLYVQLGIKIPKKLTKEQKELLERLKQKGI